MAPRRKAALPTPLPQVAKDLKTLLARRSEIERKYRPGDEYSQMDSEKLDELAPKIRSLQTKINTRKKTSINKDLVQEYAEKEKVRKTMEKGLKAGKELLHIFLNRKMNPPSNLTDEEKRICNKVSKK